MESVSKLLMGEHKAPQEETEEQTRREAAEMSERV